ncbi:MULTISPECIES: hypothetical protein [Streptomyces]|uniref:Uncharacterized protein n=2 Tax=Streptomyces TaxID=1883 RepID=A0A100Y2F7_9ACTN|nr:MULTISPECIES: hypothetical protein [Streptomyces]KUH36405.1 hypothetical protein ATE80_23840 [Streptomyces kanasensis]UUS35102.1 hypothetical protein NRO40_30325 [Streptomyces changanensis]
MAKRAEHSAITLLLTVCGAALVVFSPDAADLPVAWWLALSACCFCVLVLAARWLSGRRGR